MSNASASQPPKRKRRWFQFSLRTLLLFVTVFAIWFGTLAKRANDQRRAVAKIKALGAEVLYADQLSGDAFDAINEEPRRTYLWDLIGDDYFRCAIGSYFNTAVCKPRIPLLNDLPCVRAVCIDGDCNGALVHQVAEHRAVEILILRGTGLDDRSLAEIGRLPELRTLWLWSPDPGFSTAALGATLERLPNLRYVIVMGINATDDELSDLRRRLSRIRKVELSQTAPTFKF